MRPSAAKYLLLFVFAVSPCRASQDANFGLGAEATGRVGAVTAEVESPFAALYNPALIAAQRQAYFAFTTSVAQTSFDRFDEVIVDGPLYRTQDGASRKSSFQLPDSSVTLWAVGLTYPFNLPKALNRRAGLGVVLSGPFSSLRNFVSSTPYDFYSLRYGASDTGLKATVSASAELLPGRLFAGAGLSFYFTSAGNVETTLVTDNPTGRSALNVGLNSSFLAGLFARLEEPTLLSLVFRQSISPPFEQKFTGRVQLGGADTLYQPLLFRSTLYFEPQTVEADLQHDFGPFKASLGAGYELWRQYRPPYMVAIATDDHGNQHETRTPPLSLTNTVSPRASVEAPFFSRKLSVAAGYTYRPTPVVDLSGPGNSLDSDTHVVGISIQHHLKANDWFPKLTWGVFGQYHWLETRNVRKTAADFIGAPGYDFSGTAYTYGISIQAEL